MQNVKTIKTTSATTKTIAMSAMFAALVTVTTAFIKIPTPVGGYVHPGDSMVYLAASVLPGPFIKALNVLPFLLCRIALKNSPRYRRIINLPNLLMIIPSTIITLGGYLLANAFFKGFAVALTSLVPNLLQAIVAAVLFIALGLSLDAIQFKQKLFPQ